MTAECTGVNNRVVYECRNTGAKAKTHRDLDVYKRAFEAAMELFEHSKRFPKEELYSITSQLRRCSRSVTANLTEAWRKRRNEAAFVAKVSDAEAEAAEVQHWIEHAVRCGYLDRVRGADLFRRYDRILAILVGMILNPDTWLLAPPRNRRE